MQQQVLSPPEQRVVKAHLLDVTAAPDGVGTVLHMRPVASQHSISTIQSAGAGAEASTTTMYVPAHSFLINCTDQLGEHSNIFDPIVSEDGLVLSPQGALGFSGPSAHVLTHAWYLSVLGDHWKALVRMTASKEDKANFGIAAFYQLMFSVPAMTRLLPPEIVAASGALNSATTSGASKAIAPEVQARLRHIAGKMQTLFPNRYDDTEQYVLRKKSVLAGKIGTQAGITARL
eukprot:COSAG01_NODE_5815_length_4017_cov_3.964267_3_plen_232_part_00